MKNVAEAIGYTVRSLRKERGLSQSDVCRLSGIDRNSFQRIDAGSIANPSITNLIKIAEALGTTPGDIIDRAYKLYKESAK